MAPRYRWRDEAPLAHRASPPVADDRRAPGRRPVGGDRPAAAGLRDRPFATRRLPRPEFGGGCFARVRRIAAARGLVLLLAAGDAQARCWGADGAHHRRAPMPRATAPPPRMTAPRSAPPSDRARARSSCRRIHATRSHPGAKALGTNALRRAGPRDKAPGDRARRRRPDQRRSARIRRCGWALMAGRRSMRGRPPMIPSPQRAAEVHGLVQASAILCILRTGAQTWMPAYAGMTDTSGEGRGFSPRPEPNPGQP